jgi:excinuclease ABC subunit C
MKICKALKFKNIRINNSASFNEASTKLASLLGMKELPRTLECYDVAIWQGSSPTASQVVFTDGHPSKKDYRYYHLETVDEGNNDFAMMTEVFSRRLKRKKLPDVFVVDGGTGQVNTVKKVLEEFKIDIPLVGIAKSRIKVKAGEEERTEERLFIFGRKNPYILKNCMPLYRLIVQMRDEAHRFSRKLHHKTEKKRIFHSWVDEVKGINEKTKHELKKNLDIPVGELKQMGTSDIQEKLNISREVATKIYSYFEKLSF